MRSRKIQGGETGITTKSQANERHTFHLEAAGEELQTCGQVPVAIQPFQGLQALQADFSVLMRRENQRMETRLTILYSPLLSLQTPLSDPSF